MIFLLLFLLRSDGASVVQFQNVECTDRVVFTNTLPSRSRYHRYLLSYVVCIPRTDT